jgi:molecular chaperone DnaK
MKKRMGSTYVRDVNGLTITPEWVAACLLQVVRKAAENHIGTAIDETVITVPASFSTEQRAATLHAAKLAGLPRSLLKLVDEPTAALCHALNEHGHTFLSEGTHKQYIMMIDIGGGTFDVSIVQVMRKTNTKILDITLLGCSRYNEMAGDDFDLYIAAFLLNRMEQRRGFDSSELKHREAADLAAVTLYRAEEAKQRLSKLALETVQSPLRYNLELMEKIHVPFEITAAMPSLGNKIYREQLSVKDLGLALKRFLPDLRNKHKNREDRLYSYTIAKPIEEAMESVRHSSDSFADFDYKDLQDVLLTGGSAQLPLLEMAISRIVGHRPRILTNTMNSVGLGASVFGAWAAGEHGEQVHLHERINDSVFIHTAEGRFEEVLSKNHVIPLKNHLCRTSNLQISGGLPAKQVELRLFLGQSAQDPFMAPMTMSHFMNFPEPIPSGTPIDIHCSVGDDRCFHFTFTACLSNGIELEAKANVDMGRPDHSLEHLPQVNLI